MELGEKLQQLRKQKNYTQEELAELLFVSRTAISKWESGRGYPSIDSLKAISGVFSVSIDDLLSGEELISLAQTEQREKAAAMRDLVFGILDCMAALLFFLPLFGQPEGDTVKIVPLLSFTETRDYIWLTFAVAGGLTALLRCPAGLAELAPQNLAALQDDVLPGADRLPAAVFHCRPSPVSGGVPALHPDFQGDFAYKTAVTRIVSSL